MSRVHHIDLQCEIDPRHESIHGEMSDRQGKKLPFSGWTEFANALVTLISGETPETETGSRSLAGDGSEINQIEQQEEK